jgi:predicted transposase/invertase (TIGR01784 family)
LQLIIHQKSKKIMSKERTFISFDWAMKKILRHKENFMILEGFLSELLGFDVTIENLLESEGNKESLQDKYDRVDILAKSTKGELMLIELQYDNQDDYFHRMIYGISKLITEYISEGKNYGTIKKAFSINILYFRLGQGKDYIYEYKGNFVGKYKKDIFKPTKHQKERFNIETVADIFPKYYVIRVNNFQKDVIERPLDEWIYFLKNSDIKDDFHAKGMERAKEALNYEKMSEEEKSTYSHHIKNRRIESSVLETAEGRGARKEKVIIAKKGLAKGVDWQTISDMTGLDLEDIERLAKGKKIDID